MAGHRAINGIMLALKECLSSRMASMLDGKSEVKLVGSQELNGKPTSKALGIYLYRLAVDPFARNRYLSAPEGSRTPRPELPLNLHVLLIGWSNDTDTEVSYLSAAVQIIGSALNLGISHLGVYDPTWGESDTVQVIPEEMSNEDLTRLWDSLASGYRLSVPYIIKTVRLSPSEEPTEGPPVKTLVYPVATNVEANS